MINPQMRQSFRLQGGQKSSYQITQHRLGSVWSRGPDGWSGISAASDKWLMALRTVYRCKSYQDHSHRNKSVYKKIRKPCCEHELFSIYWAISIDLFSLHPSIFQWQQAHASDRHTACKHYCILSAELWWIPFWLTYQTNVFCHVYGWYFYTSL